MNIFDIYVINRGNIECHYDNPLPSLFVTCGKSSPRQQDRWPGRSSDVSSEFHEDGCLPTIVCGTPSDLHAFT